MTTKDRVKKLAEIFKALSDVNRLRIIRMLSSNMVKTLTVSDLADKLGVSQPAATQHIKILKNIGLLEPNKEGFRIYYQINTDILVEMNEEVQDMFKLVHQKCSEFESCKGHN